MTSKALAETHAAAFIHSRPWSAAEFDAVLEKDTTLLIGNAASFIVVQRFLDEAEILTLATHPEAARQGMAHANLEAMAQGLAAEGTKKIFLEVAADNDAARALYAKVGFAQVGMRPAYYQRESAPPMDAIILEMALN